MSSLLHTFLAQAGGGSGGFSGGGGGGGGIGGGGSSGSGGGSGLGFLVVVGIFAVFLLAGAISAARENARRAKRVRQVELASAEAAEDDDYLGAERVNAEAADLYVAVQAAWDARDQDRLAQLVGADLMVEWRRRLDDFARKGWHNRVRLLSAPRIQYVGLVNREDDAEDRVTVLVTARMESYVETTGGGRLMKSGEGDETIEIGEYWTLARQGDGWICVSIEQAEEGAHHLAAPIVATPEADTERLRGQAVTELAEADAVPEGFTTADLAVVDFEGTAREEALDLSVQDGRFAPDVLEVAARRAVSAWAEAVDGSDAALEAVASPEMVQTLLYGADSGGQTRLVLRGPAARRIAIAAVDAAATPATMTVEVELAAVRYVEDRDTTTVVSGSKDRPSTFTQRWTLALQGRPNTPWVLVASSV